MRNLDDGGVELEGLFNRWDMPAPVEDDELYAGNFTAEALSGGER